MYDEEDQTLINYFACYESFHKTNVVMIINSGTIVDGKYTCQVSEKVGNIAIFKAVDQNVEELHLK